jgi:hypothetical protein
MANEDDIQSQVARTRANLENTLDAIEDKFNVPRRASELSQRARASYESNPRFALFGTNPPARAGDVVPNRG